MRISDWSSDVCSSDLHAQALARLDGLDVVRCLQQRLVRARVEPRVAAAKLLEVQPALLEIAAIEVGDFQFAARRRLERGSEVAGTPAVEVQPGHRVVRARLGRLFLKEIGGA